MDEQLFGNLFNPEKPDFPIETTMRNGDNLAKLEREYNARVLAEMVQARAVGKPTTE